MRRQLGHGTAIRILFSALVVTALAACGSAASTPAAAAPGDTPRTAAGDFSGEPVPSAAASAAAASEGGAPAAGDTGSGSAVAAIDNSLQIVYTGSLQLVVTDVDQAVAKAKTAVLASGGYVGGSQESSAGDQPTATITYRIPAKSWDDTIAAIRSTATKVVAEQTQASEVGAQVVDLEARIANLRASEAALQDIAKTAGNVNDLLQIQQQLSDVRGQIEELDAQHTRLQDQVAYGTLVATFGVEVEQVKTAAKGWDPAGDVDGATATMINVGQRLVSAAIWFLIVWVPFLIVGLVVLFVAWRVFRRYAPKPPAQQGPIAGWTGGGTPPEA